MLGDYLRWTRPTNKTAAIRDAEPMSVENHGWRSPTRRDTHSARREHPMSVDVIHAVMGVVYVLTWACIGQMNVRHRTDPEVEANRPLR